MKALKIGVGQILAVGRDGDGTLIGLSSRLWVTCVCLISEEAGLRIHHNPSATAARTMPVAMIARALPRGLVERRLSVSGTVPTDAGDSSGSGLTHSGWRWAGADFESIRIGPPAGRESFSHSASTFAMNR